MLTPPNDMTQTTQRLSEAQRWYALERPFERDLASGEIKKVRDRIHVADAVVHATPHQAVHVVLAARATLLDEEWNRQAKDVQIGRAGRILLLLVTKNLRDGSAWFATHGFFGELNYPPSDFWIGILSVPDPTSGGVEPALASWIPEEFESVVQEAIDVNPEGCLLWGDQVIPALGDVVRV